MQDEFEITIPTDDDGFVLLRCPKCGEYFKLLPSEFNDDNVDEIFCPQCGLTSETYITDDVIELGTAITHNQMLDMIEGLFDGLEKSTKKSMIQFKTTKKAKREDEIPIRSSVDALEKTEFDCCNRSAKLRGLLIYCGSYCPYCGGKQDGNN